MTSEKRCLPLLELRVDDPGGESLAANTDAFKHTVTLELVHDQVGVNQTGLLLLVGNDATHEVRVGAVQTLHELGQRFL